MHDPTPALSAASGAMKKAMELQVLVDIGSGAGPLYDLALGQLQEFAEMLLAWTKEVRADRDAQQGS